MSSEAEFQKFIFSVLTSDAELAAIIGDRVYDDVPEGAQFPYVSFGPHDVNEDDAGCIVAGEHSLQLDVWSREVGSVQAKQIVSKIKSILHDNDGEMTVNALASVRVTNRRVFRDPDGNTTHGVLNITALIEENDG